MQIGVHRSQNLGQEAKAGLSAVGHRRRRPRRPADADRAWTGQDALERCGRRVAVYEDIAKVITQAVTARRPRSRYLINPVAKGLVAMNQVLPARAYDSMMRRQYGLPR